MRTEQEIAEIRRAEGIVRKRDWMQKPTPAELRAAATLAVAWVEERREDDHERLTIDWLLLRGFDDRLVNGARYLDLKRYYTDSLPAVRFRVSTAGVITGMEIWGVLATLRETRGELRRLVPELGINGLRGDR